MIKKRLNIALAGQANVGKSVFFNQLTGIHQHIGNWPGKTIEKSEGTLFYKSYTIDVVDLPGIYSLSTYTIEEIVSREFIINQDPDFVINVVDSSNLERNLIFTLQLLELEQPMVLALNMADIAKKKGFNIDNEKLGEILGIPVVSCVASKREGVTNVLDEGIKLLCQKTKPKIFKFKKEIETKIEELEKDLKNIHLNYPTRWLAIRLLEQDSEVEKLVEKQNKQILEKAYGHPTTVLISNERCLQVSRIIKETTEITESPKISIEEKLHNLTCHKILGYPIMILVLGLIFFGIFSFGTCASSLLEKLTSNWHTYFNNFFGSGIFASISWAIIESIMALIDLAVPYLIPFYILLFTLENSGYLARVAFLLDNLMHKMGIHGKGAIPLILSFGCNVPACLSCRIMETKRERFITGFLTAMVPCSAVTIIVMKLVGENLGLSWVVGLYIFALLVIFSVGFVSSKILPGEPTELLMEMPDYKFPSLKAILIQTWFKLKNFIFMAAPLVIISGVIIKSIYLLGWFPAIANFLSPITTQWLGLPAISGILLIFGLLRKELILLMLATLLNTSNFAAVLTPVQMIVLALVSMFYVPCIGTIAALNKEFGWKKSLGISFFQISLALILGGLGFRILSLLNI